MWEYYGKRLETYLDRMEKRMGRFEEHMKKNCKELKNYKRKRQYTY